MKNIAIFASGGGTDMQSVIDACENGLINGRVVTVITNSSHAGALDRAKKHNISSKIFLKKNYDNSDFLRDQAIVEYLKPLNIDLIVLAGYLAIVTPALVNEYEGRMINIHPSLIPNFCGKGMYGMKVHEAVIAAKAKESGCTVHFVDEGADTGKIIEQIHVKVLEDDTPETLQKRILIQEHILLPKVVAMLCNK